MDGFFKRAVQALDETYTSSERSQVFSSFAAFADDQYQEMSKATKEKRDRFAAYTMRKEVEFTEIDRQLGIRSSSGPSSNQLEKSRSAGEAQLKEDQRQLELAEQATVDMRWRALENYGKALSESDEHDDKMLRFCALWLAHSTDNDLNSKLKPLLASIPSHKFVFLAYQLSARLSKPSSPTPFSKAIHRLVVRLCTDHPFHSLFPVNALRDAAGQAAPTKGGRSRRSSTAPVDSNSNNGRAQAANDVVEKVKRVPSLQARVEAIDLACDAYREWADYNILITPYLVPGSTKSVKKGFLPIAKSTLLKKQMLNLPIPVTTFNLLVDVNCLYDPSSFPSIAKYADTFRNAGGINMPKIVVCIGNDGKEYTQLVRPVAFCLDEVDY